jgi:hypothetical protein
VDPDGWDNTRRFDMSNLTLSAYQEAEAKAAHEEAGRGFTVHLVVTLLVWVGLIAVNVFVASEFPWSVFPIVGMSIGLLAHWYFGVLHGDRSVREHQREIERRAA